VAGVEAANVRYLETNRELETNTTVVNLWSRFVVVNRRRSRDFPQGTEVGGVSIASMIAKACTRNPFSAGLI